jgi:hypothetical protein
LADQLPGGRSRARKNTQPVNKPKGITVPLQREQGADLAGNNPEAVEPDRRDIRPKDVFSPSPKNLAVQNLYETGRDLERAIEKQVPKDRGYDSVYNLSQYLIKTEDL